MPHQVPHCYEFGPYRLDPGQRVLTRAGETISLPHKAIDILIMLVMKAGELVHKDVLLKEVWPDTFVEENNLTQQIFTLRRALGDERADPRYIETITRRGYRFVAPVRTNESPEYMEVKSPGDSTPPIVAVLPFVNSTRDEELEYLVDGLTDNIINSLSRISKLRVMSRSAVFRYKAENLDPQKAGKDLGASVVLVGKIKAQRTRVVVDVELVDAATGWQLWGKSFDSETKDLLEIQSAVIRQLLATLKLELTGAEEKRVTARYTENGEAYQAYLEGRYHWSRYTKKGIEKAIQHFRQAINLDPNYALAYAGIVDCYLRLATNYLPPENDLPISSGQTSCEPRVGTQPLDETDPRVKLRFEWDWRSAERELRRANELNSTYPAAPQWYEVYRASKRIYEKAQVLKRDDDESAADLRFAKGREALPPYIPSLELTPTEQVQVYCAVVREQIDVGNYEAGCKIIRAWWSFGNWPKLDGLNQQSCGDLLFTTGELAGFVASSTQLPRGQKHGEELLHGSVALFEQLGLKSRASEARIELALCYHRQGLFDIARATLTRVLTDLPNDNWELRSLAFMRLGSLERQAGRLKDALARLIEATASADRCGPWITARCHLELASIYKDLAAAEDVAVYFDQAMQSYLKALYEFEAIGNHRYIAIVVNNMGLLLLMQGDYNESEKHLWRSRRLFDGFADTLRSAQVNETLARLYIQTKQYALAETMIKQAVKTFEMADNEALLAEGFITSAVIAAKLGQYNLAKKSFEAAYRISERCSDNEGAGLALLIMFEEIGERLEHFEKIQVSEKLKMLLATTQQTSLQRRLRKSLVQIGLKPQESDKDTGERT